MPAWNDAELGYPPRDHVVEYLTAYEQRYDLGRVSKDVGCRYPSLGLWTASRCLMMTSGC
jgi:hypothetical protein